jgi:hypothetical protein
VAGDIEKGLRKRVWKDEIGIDAGRKDRDALGEGFDEGHAQRPDIASRSQAGSGDFWGVVGAGPGGGRVRLCDRGETVAGQFQLVGGGENVGGSYVPVDQAFAMEIDENIENGPEHVAGFCGGESTLGEYLREVFFGKLHYGVEKIGVAEAATAEVVEVEKIGMSKLRDEAPTRKLEIDCGGIQGKKLDGGLLGRRIATLGEEHGAVFIACQELLERKLVIDELTFELFPDSGHVAPPKANSYKTANRDT